MYVLNFLQGLLVSLIISLSVVINIYSQTEFLLNPPQFKNININDGLSDSYVTSMVQDHKGFMWFGTWEGLNRYDGYEFKIYRHDVEDSSSVASDHIQTLTLMKDSSLWVGTNNGIAGRFNRSNNSFTNYKIRPATDKPVFINKIFEHSNGSLYIGTSDGLYILNRKNNQVTEYNFTEIENVSARGVKSIFEDTRGNLFIGTDYYSGGLFYLDLSANKTYHFTNSSIIIDEQKAINVTDIIINKKKQLLLGTNSGLYEFQLMKFYHTIAEKALQHNCSFEEFSTPIKTGYQIRSLAEDVHSNLWIGNFRSNGLFNYHFDEDLLIDIDFQGDNNEKFSSLAVISIFIDRAGVIWLGTTGAGIYRHTPSLQKFYFLNQSSEGMYRINSKSIQAVLKDSKGRLWIGGYGGLNIIDLENRESRFLNNLSSIKSNKNRDPSPIRSVYEDLKEGKEIYWIGTEGFGLYKYDFLSNQLVDYYKPDNIFEKPLTKIQHKLNARTVYTMIRDHQGDLWVGTDAGLEKFDPVQGDFRRMPIPNNLCGDLYKEIVKIVEPQNNTNILLLATANCGLLVYNTKSSIFERLEPTDEEASNIIGLNINEIFEDHQGRLWVGTNQGLCVLNIKDIDYSDLSNLDGIVSNKFTIENGLPNNKVNGILEDDQGIMWISSNRGLTRLDPETDEIRNFDVSDGLQDIQFNIGAYFKASDGTLYFGGKNGINYFDPLEIEYNNSIPEIAFTQFSVLNQSFSMLDENGNEIDINESKSITIRHDQNNISFSFAALDFSEPTRNQYAYKMEGFNDNWIYIGDRREAVYTNLHPGSYTFRVKASNNDGFWNEEGKEITLIINPPWWKTNWAIIIWAIIFGFIMYFLNRFFVYRIKLNERLKFGEERVAELQELNKLKSNFFANISHEFRTPLTLILNPVKTVTPKIRDKEIVKELSLVERNAEKLLQMINQILDLSKLEVGKLTKVTKTGDLVQSVMIISSSFDSLAQNLSVSFHKIIPYNSLVTSFNSNHLEKILNNVLSNAFKFTEKGGKVKLLIDLMSKDGHTLKNNEINIEDIASCRITVRDTGIGISNKDLPHIFDRFYQVDTSSKRKYEGTGIGLSLVKELIELYNGSVEVKSETGWGTEVILILPLEYVYSVNIESVEKVERLEYDQESEINPEPEHKDYGLVDITENLVTSAKNIIMIVEDNEDLRTHMRGFLREEFQILEASNGVEGLQIAIDNIPDLIVSDVMMPGMDGFEMSTKLKEDKRTSHIPIVLLTAKASRKDKLSGLELGVDEYLPKPFDGDELKIRIRNLIDIRSKLQEQYVALETSGDDGNTTSSEMEFLIKTRKVINENIDNEQFTVEDLSRELGMSRVQFHRKIKALTNYSTTHFIRNIRLNRAKQLLEEGNYNVTEIAYMVGFSSQSYFTKSFQKHFGFPPSGIKK